MFVARIKADSIRFASRNNDCKTIDGIQRCIQGFTRWPISCSWEGDRWEISNCRKGEEANNIESKRDRWRSPPFSSPRYLLTRFISVLPRYPANKILERITSGAGYSQGSIRKLYRSREYHRLRSNGLSKEPDRSNDNPTYSTHEDVQPLISRLERNLDRETNCIDRVSKYCEFKSSWTIR